MSATIRRTAAGALCVALVLALAPAASAYYPLGFFDEYNVLYIMKWRFGEFDTNNDGLVNANEGEGVELWYEGGDFGFTDDEIDILNESFQVWEDVQDSYAAFQDGRIIQGTVPVAPEIDLLPTIFMANEGDPEAGNVGGGIAGVTIPVLADTEGEVIVTADQAVYVSVGQIIDMDIVLDATLYRTAEGQTEPLADLKGVMVHEIGHFLGLGHPPNNNLRYQYVDPDDPLNVFGLEENAVFWFTDPHGVSDWIGVTPTMYPIIFDVRRSDNTIGSGQADLAPDDISGLISLYPREGGDWNLFRVEDEVRSQTREGQGLPSIPIAKAHVVAWADIYDTPDPRSAQRVAMFSTISGLWETQDSPALYNRFSLRGLWKQFERPGSANPEQLYTPTYTFSANPLDQSGLGRQAPEGRTPEEHDTTHQDGGAAAYLAWESEVFHESDDLFDVDNHDGGTPFYWDFSRNKLVSYTSGKTLAQILPTDTPMFGDSTNDVCPFNRLDPEGTTTDTGDTGTTGTLVKNRLRGFRDNTLLASGMGALLVDVYYRLAPYLTWALDHSEWALAAARTGVHGIGWVLTHLVLVRLVALLALLTALGLGAVRVLRRRWAHAAAALIVVLGLLLGASPAHAAFVYISTEDLTAQSTQVVSGVIDSISMYRAENGYVYTSVNLMVSGVAKGAVNEKSLIQFTMLGGRADGLMMPISTMPKLKEGQELVVFLRENGEGQPQLWGGTRGSLTVRTAKDGSKVVTPSNETAAMAMKVDDLKISSKQTGIPAEDLAKVRKDQKLDQDMSSAISLEDYMDHLRDIVREQKQAEADAE